MSEYIPEYIEDILETPVEAENILTHEALVGGGLSPIRAYARTRSSKAAMRAKKRRDKLEAGEGTVQPQKQLNVLAPVDEDARAAIKELANALVDGRMKPADVKDVRSEEIQLGRAAKRVLSRGGIKAAALRMIIGIKI
jgi:hypothetical protein